MSTIDMDDLVASLSSTCHIGQEAIDLKTLQAQLSQTLYQFPGARSGDAPCGRQNGTGMSIPFGYAPNTTPTLSPVSSSGWLDEGARQRRLSRRSTGGDSIITEEDELMMDDRDHRLAMESPSSCYSHPSPAASRQAHGHPSAHFQAPHHLPHSSSHASHQHRAHYEISSQSSFATSDPFYLAELHASCQPQPSFFAPPSQPSNFYPPAAHMDPRTYVTAGYTQKESFAIARR